MNRETNISHPFPLESNRMDTDAVVQAQTGVTELDTKTPPNPLILSLSKEAPMKDGSGGMGGSTGSPRADKTSL